MLFRERLHYRSEQVQATFGRFLLDIRLYVPIIAGLRNFVLDSLPPIADGLLVCAFSSPCDVSANGATGEYLSMFPSRTGPDVANACHVSAATLEVRRRVAPGNFPLFSPPDPIYPSISTLDADRLLRAFSTQSSLRSLKCRTRIFLPDRIGFLTPVEGRTR